MSQGFSGMGRWLLKVYVLSVLFVSAMVQAVVYDNGLNTSSWHVKTSVFECRLVQQIPYFGEATFLTRAGESSQFSIRTKSKRFQAGSAGVSARSPVWRPDSQQLMLGDIPVKRGLHPVWLQSQWAETLMARLYEGFEVELQRPYWFDNQEQPPAQMVMSTVGFRSAYQRYLNCLTGLLPSNFDQLKRTVLLFPPGPTEVVDARIERQLDNILQLVKHDKTIRVFYIDGHTDSAGDRVDNLALSKARAELVAAYLKRRGVPQDWINLRWHGERYPVASNGTAAGRARNRRVTVRIERVEEIEVLPLAAEP